MDGFRNELARVNTIADATPGFVRRLQTDAGDATAIREQPEDGIEASIVEPSSQRSTVARSRPPDMPSL